MESGGCLVSVIMYLRTIFGKSQRHIIIACKVFVGDADVVARR